MTGMFEVYQIGMKKILELVSFDIDKIVSLDLKEFDFKGQILIAKRCWQPS